ncbi:HD-GYP domain-containing protein [Arcobacter sp. CECT 8985]|uniref:HD-GYP domain-containing protein n=1 Tax=Arcobacter sp. CECT 8985 TaxID=1935424 RepID=UPI00100B6A27|nr:HD domain-containing phosphohydrolase [Arcobacter sp. CECT 8985]RXJ84033.1 phosphohydrolase [Arcobacter sp. CECT 8985]
MDKKKQILFNLNNFLLATSFIFDYINKNKKHTNLGYLKRVTYMSLNMAIKLGFDSKNLADLCSYCLCSNIGLYRSNDDKQMCELSNEYIKEFEFLTKQNDILLYQKEHFDGSGIFGKKDNEIPLNSQIIALCSQLNENFDFSEFNPKIKNKAIEFLVNNKNTLFDEKLVDTFLEVSQKTSFWLDLEDENDILLFIYNLLDDYTTVVNFENILNMTKTFLILENPNSKLINYVEKISNFYGFEHKDKLTLQISACLCRLGKLVFSEELLEKKQTLTTHEYEKIRTYPYYTKKVLSNIMGFNDILKWAIKVQEKLDGSGYVYSLDAKDLSLKDRVLINLNIYDALTQKKVYREKYSHSEAIKIMKIEASKGKIDGSIVENMDEILK